MENWDPAVVKLLGIFMPTTFERRAAVARESRFVHYTTAENLFHILDSEEIWFRNTRDMNDHQDIESGMARVQQWLNHSEDSASLIRALNACAPGAWDEGVGKYDRWLADIRNQSYVLSVSEHDLGESNTGRLSMWRAYEKGAVGIAVVVKTAPFMQVTEALKAYSSPVAYWTRQQFLEEFRLVTKSIIGNRDFLSKLNRAALTETVFLMLLFAATCSKHPGLRDEREWRVLTNPLLWPSPRLTEHRLILDGMRQTVYRMPLKNSSQDDVHGLEFAELIDRVIIGPATNAEEMRRMIIARLADKNVSDPETKVILSKLPVRPKDMA